MRKCGIKSSRFTLASVLSAIASLAALDYGLLVHGEAIKQGLDSSIYVESSLISLYGKCEILDAAKQVFDVIFEKNMVTWNAMLGVYAQNGYFNHEEEEADAFKMFNRMRLHGIVPDEVALASILSACGNVKLLEAGLQFHCLAVKLGLETNLFVGSSLIHMYSKHWSIEDARKIYSSMLEWSVVSMNTLILGYALKNIKEAINILSEMMALGIKPSKITFTSLIDACEGFPVILRLHIHCAIVKRQILSILMWTALISGCTQNDCCYEAINSYREMQDNSFFLDQPTFVSVLRACPLLPALQDRKEIHSLIFHTGFDLDELTSSALIDMYAKCRDVKKSALKFFNEMAHSCVTPDDVTFLEVLTACSHAGWAFEGRQIFYLMVNCYSIKPRADHYACIVDLLGR
ncbi:Pentatricopeptide repeat-containing protein [Arachis hypogaea]|nr:Pentatricopeptide repeat-containing protein [Arachis hypogaea]